MQSTPRLLGNGIAIRAPPVARIGSREEGKRIVRQIRARRPYGPILLRPGQWLCGRGADCLVRSKRMT